MTTASVSSYHLPAPMDSYPEPVDGYHTRRPPSVNSRSANTRRHRNSRSHSGGASYRPQNEFPNFSQTGDVEIVVSADGQEKRYMLHRLILAQCSGFFEAGTSEDWSRAQARAQSSDNGAQSSHGLSRISEDEESKEPAGSGQSGPPPDRFRWRYELDWGNNDDEIPMLVQKVSVHYSTI